MNNLSNINLKQTLPYSISEDENIQALAEAITVQLLAVNSKIDLLRILPNLSKLPEAVVDQMGWHLSVDFYDVNLPRATKEQLLYQSVAWHRRKGTVKVVEEMVTAVHSHGRVIENWDYGGEPYHFKVLVEGEPITDPKALANLTEAINSVKNVRSWFDGIDYERGTAFDIYYGGATYIHREVVING